MKPILVFIFSLSNLFLYAQEGSESLPGDLSLPSSAEEIFKLELNETRRFKYTVEDFFLKPKKIVFFNLARGNLFFLSEKR